MGGLLEAVQGGGDVREPIADTGARSGAVDGCTIVYGVHAEQASVIVPPTERILPLQLCAERTYRAATHVRIEWGEVVVVAGEE